MAELCCRAFQEQHADGSDGWDPTSPRWDGEKYLYGIPIYDSEEIIEDADGIDNLLKSLAAVQNPRIHVRTTFHTCAVGITWFSCVREFFNGILGAVIGHRNAYLYRGVLHCDVSDTNIWMRVKKALPVFAVPDWPTDKPSDWYPKRSGMTGDWGFGRDKTLPASDDKVYLTGTFPFQAAVLLSPLDTTVQGVHHDLESFFWVIWIICVNMIGPFDRRATWIVQEEPLYASANTSEVPEHLLSSTGNHSTQGRSGGSSAARREDTTKEERDE
ncbi:hypothetical protein F5141DRAFT_1002968 [Pisolithus sp. B1]|nr:hypothetical protein F5141DRAFT_1002968 [Pisolithus sp. B1]